MTSENLAQLKREAEAVDQNRIMRYIRIFSNLSNDIKFATQKRILIEIAIIKLCKPQLETDTDSLADRIRVLEEKFEQGVFVNPDSTAEGGMKQEEAANVPLPKALSEDIKKAAAKWVQITAGVSNPGQSMLRKCKLSVSEDDRLIIAVMDPMNFEYLKSDAVSGEIRGSIENVIGKTMEFDMIFSENKGEFAKNYPDLSAIKMDIVTEDQ
jgi:DNA polymerase-3 subunit gamma/tau